MTVRYIVRGTLIVCLGVLIGCMQTATPHPLDELGALSPDEEAYLVWAADAVDDMGDVINEVLNDDSKELDSVRDQLFYQNDVTPMHQPPQRLTAFHEDLVESGTLLENALRAIDEDGDYDWTEFFEATTIYIDLTDELSSIGY